MNIAIIMDDVRAIDPAADSTFGLGLEARRRGHQLFYANIEDISLRDEKPFAALTPLEFSEGDPHWKFTGEERLVPLNEMDRVLMRKDPPFDERFVFATHLLSFCEPGKVVNHPQSILASPEKLYAYRFPGIFPKSLITHKLSEVKDFLDSAGGRAVLKPLNGNGGAGVFLLEKGGVNVNAIWEVLSGEGKKPLVVQEFLPEVEEGDMRVVCVNGEVEGMLLRTPQSGEIRANIHAGGTTRLVEQLSPKQQWLCDQVKDQLRKDGLYFVGLDLIGDRITEINVTSPTGIREILRYGGVDVAKVFWDRIGEYRPEP